MVQPTRALSPVALFTHPSRGQSKASRYLSSFFFCSCADISDDAPPPDEGPLWRRLQPFPPVVQHQAYGTVRSDSELSFWDRCGGDSALCGEIVTSR